MFDGLYEAMMAMVVIGGIVIALVAFGLGAWIF